MRIDERLTGDINAVHMDESIRPLVGILNAAGLPTTMSCAGHFERSGLYGFDGWVQFEPSGWKNFTDTRYSQLEAFVLAGARSNDKRWAVDLRYSGQRSGRRIAGRINVSPRLVIWTSVVILEKDTRKRAAWKTSIIREVERAATDLLK